MTRERVPLDLGGMTGAVELFRVPGGVSREPGVEAWLNGEPDELRSIARRWFAEMRQCGDDVVELMHDGGAVACVADVPFAYVATFAAHANVGFFYGAMLPDPARLLTGSGKRMRHVKLKPGVEVDFGALRELVRVAYRDVRVRIREHADRR